MRDKDKTREQLINELAGMRQRLTQLEASQAEAKPLAKGLRLLSSVVEQTTEGMAVADLEGNLLFVNNAFAAMHGYTPHELVGKHLSTFHTAEQMPSVDESIWLIRKTGRFSGEVWHVRRDGTVFPTLMQNSLLRDDSGNRVGVVASVRDISESKRVEKELESSREQLRNLSAHLQFVREEERAHVAREIHDELGQALTALKMDLSWLGNRLAKGQESLLQKAKSMSNLIDANIEIVKRVSTELRPGLLDDLGITAAVEWQTKEFQSRIGIRCRATLDPADIDLDQDRSTAIFRILQETLTNVARHANATRVNVSLKEKGGQLVLRVRDNGKGITQEQISHPESIGLIGIRERVYSWGGEVIINGIPGKGTSVTASIPLNEEKPPW